MTMTQMIVKTYSPHPDRRHLHKWLFYHIMGDCQFQLDLFAECPLPVQMIFWFLRGVGAPIFLNNPISGLLILMAMFLSDPWVAGGASLGLAVAILFAMLLGQKREAVISGGCTFHGMLCGIVCAAELNSKTASWQVCFVIILLSVISVYVNVGLVSILGTMGLPALNMPFNLTMFVFLGALGAHNSRYPNNPAPDLQLMGQTMGANQYNFEELLTAIPNSLGHIYGCREEISGYLILLAIAVNSPITGIFAVLASIVSILIAMIINTNPALIISGFMTYNAVLATCSAAGFFWVFNWQNAILSLVAGAFATFTHGLLTRLLTPAEVPALAFAFNITAFVFLAFASRSPLFKRVPMDQTTYPEEHYLKWGYHESKQVDNNVM